MKKEKSPTTQNYIRKYIEKKMLGYTKVYGFLFIVRYISFPQCSLILLKAYFFKQSIVWANLCCCWLLLYILFDSMCRLVITLLSKIYFFLYHCWIDFYSSNNFDGEMNRKNHTIHHIFKFIPRLIRC